MPVSNAVVLDAPEKQPASNSAAFERDSIERTVTSFSEFSMSRFSALVTFPKKKERKKEGTVFLEKELFVSAGRSAAAIDDSCFANIRKRALNFRNHVFFCSLFGFITDDYKRNRTLCMRHCFPKQPLESVSVDTRYYGIDRK